MATPTRALLPLVAIPHTDETFCTALVSSVPALAVPAVSVRIFAKYAVLLASACSSFEMLESYAQRGDLFQAAVRALEPGAAWN